MEARRQLVSILRHLANTMVTYAELDFFDKDYYGTFLKSLAVIGDIGTAVLVHKGYYVPSARHVFRILHLQDIQDKYSKYLADPDGEIITRYDARSALEEAKRLLRFVDIAGI